MSGPTTPSGVPDGAHRPGSAPALAVVAAGLVAVAVGGYYRFWLGGLLLAGLLVGLAAARLVLPVRALGPLAVRSRVVDATTCVVLAVGAVAMATSAPGGLLA